MSSLAEARRDEAWIAAEVEWIDFTVSEYRRLHAVHSRRLQETRDPAERRRIVEQLEADAVRFAMMSDACDAARGRHAAAIARRKSAELASREPTDAASS